MRRSAERILTTHCGRLPDPSTMGAFEQARASGDEVRAAELLGDGVREIVREQRERGVDVIGDGEFHKPAFRDPDYYLGRWSGITQVEAGADEPTWFGGRSPEALDPRFERFFEFVEEHGIFPDTGARRSLAASHRLTVVGPLAYRGQDVIRGELELVRRAFEMAGVDHTETFYPQLAPGWLGHFVFDEHHASAEERWYALAEAW
jgi:5-methyltetrahydropteroyltriglutamate--homocysteine methyltransferase